MNFKLRSVMTHMPTTVRPEQRAIEAYRIFNDSGFHHLPVIDENRVVIGMVSRTDIDLQSAGATLFRNPNRKDHTENILELLLIESIMTKTPVFLSPENTIKDAYQIFMSQAFRALPVIEDGKLVGIITPIDLVKPFVN